MKVVEFVDFLGEKKTISIEAFISDQLVNSGIETNVSNLASTLARLVDKLVQMGILEQEDLSPEYLNFFSNGEKIVDLDLR